MTPELLDQLLTVLRKQGVQSAEVLTDGSLRVVFEPGNPGPLPGDAPTPGGWKSPDRLDNAEQFEIP